MSGFLIRSVRESDLQALFTIAGTFNLLNLPADEGVLAEKIKKSIASFDRTLPQDETEYMFVVEDVKTKKAVGTSLVIGKHGSEKFPHTYFELSEKEKFSSEIGIGFIHQVLKLGLDYDGPTEIGGLLVDQSYRGRPEKVGKQISLIRFLYMAMYPERFEERVLCELTPPYSSDGRSEFWEALGRRFTGLDYQEADYLSRQNREFIKRLFPEEEVYTCLLDAKARYVIGRVGLSTMPAKHLLESIGFKYLKQVDPFDGGPHYGVKRKDITVVKKAKVFEVSDQRPTLLETHAFVAVDNGEFLACATPYEIKSKKLTIPDSTKGLLGIKPGDKVWLTPIDERDL